MRPPILALAAALVACRREPPPAPAPRPAPPAAQTADVPAPRPPTSLQARRLAALDEGIQGHERMAAARADNWLDLERAALLYLQRARLSGDYDDYGRAEDALTRAFQRAPQGAGPLLTRASFNYAVHRVLRVEDDLRAVERWVVVSPDQREAIASLRADVAYHSGRYPEARRMYEELLGQRRSVGRLVALAQLEWKTNHFDRAQTLLDEAQRVAEGEPEESRAWLRMVRGMMESDRGRWEESLAQFREALRVRPGSWVIEEHVAEVLAWMGRHEEARLMYADLVARTQDPEFMDQLADLEARRGQTAQAQALIVRARTIYERRAARFPEATAGHAIEFFLKHAPARALELATLDRAARPGGESQVRYARALVRNGRFAEARATLDAVRQTVWNTADLHATLSVVAAQLGDAALAATARAAALAIDPHAMDDADEILPDPTDGGATR